MGRKIEKIIDAIALIAVQTSMLAVSGAVEAARAGESGKGFAVVSNDIRSLSREASDNVERAKDTVQGILDQIATLRATSSRSSSAREVQVQNNRTRLRRLAEHREGRGAPGEPRASRSSKARTTFSPRPSR